MAKIEEKDVKTYLEPFLNESDLWIREFRLPSCEKYVDFISFSWTDGYEIKIQGFECKGTISIFDYVNETLPKQIENGF